MLMYKTLFVIYFAIVCICNAQAQNSFRFKADITTKIKNTDGTFQYTKGSAFYDRNVKKIIYNITFPQKEIFVSIDTLVYKYVNNKQESVMGNPLKPEFSIYHFMLNNDISDFGLKKSSFTVGNVEKADDLIITKWIPPAGNNSFFGNIIVSTKSKRLNSVLIYNAEGVLVNRQIYKKYKSVNGIEIPTEILTITYFGDVKKYQIVEFRNVVINETGNDSMYNFNISKI